MIRIDLQRLFAASAGLFYTAIPYHCNGIGTGGHLKYVLARGYRFLMEIIEIHMIVLNRNSAKF